MGRAEDILEGPNCQQVCDGEIGEREAEGFVYYGEVELKMPG